MNIGVLSNRQNEKIKRWYNFFNFIVRLKNKNIEFLNLGYVESSESEFDTLDIEDRTNDLRQRQIQLYIKLISNIKWHNKNIAEVGSGFGGGNIVLKKYFKYKTYVGFDANQYSINKCNKKLRDDNTMFYKYSYQSFVNLNRKYDFIISLEASLHFEDIDLFFKNVSNSLINGGYFLYGDIFPTNNLSNITNLLQEHKLELINKTIVTDNVVKSIETNPDLSLIQRIWHYIFLEKGNLGFTKKSTFYKKLVSHELEYILFVFCKIV